MPKGQQKGREIRKPKANKPKPAPQTSTFGGIEAAKGGLKKKRYVDLSAACYGALRLNMHDKVREPRGECRPTHCRKPRRIEAISPETANCTAAGSFR